MQSNKETLVILTVAVNLAAGGNRQVEFALLSFARDGELIQLVADGINLKHKEINNEEGEIGL